MTIYFDRTQPLYFTYAPSFDGIPVELPKSSQKVVDNIIAIRLLIDETEAIIKDAPSAERSNPEIAEGFVRSFKEITNAK
jgi:hypothetical protein